MRKQLSKRGFTLAELLVVVAIIGVLVAVAIPVFSASQKKARLAADHAAVRDAYAMIQIANNLQELELDGTTYTFAQMQVPGFPKGYIFFLSKDCNSILGALGHTSDDYYLFQETGMPDDSTPCAECSRWNDPGVLLPISMMHDTQTYGGSVYITFIKSENRLALGYTLNP